MNTSTSTNARKRQFWVWSAYTGEPGTAFVTEIGGLEDDDTRRLLNGEALDPVPDLSVRQADPGRFTDVLGNYVGVLVLAPPLAEVLQAARARVQMVPLAVRRRPALRYAIANVLDRAPVLDLRHSRLTMYAGTDVIDRVSQLVLAPAAERAPAIFHVAEHPVLVLVDDDLRRRLQDASATPGVLTPVEEWRNDD